MIWARIHELKDGPMARKALPLDDLMNRQRHLQDALKAESPSSDRNF
jgi:hypothetical protein